MTSLSDLNLGPDPAIDRRQPIDDPLPDGAPVIDDPSREVPAVDPRRRDAPEPVREPRRDPQSESTPH
jgi:hypothetical protein